MRAYGGILAIYITLKSQLLTCSCFVFCFLLGIGGSWEILNLSSLILFHCKMESCDLDAHASLRALQLFI